MLPSGAAKSEPRAGQLRQINSSNLPWVCKFKKSPRREKALTVAAFHSPPPAGSGPQGGRGSDGFTNNALYTNSETNLKQRGRWEFSK